MENTQIREQLMLAQKVIGVANMGFAVSPRIAHQARQDMERLQKFGLHAPKALEVLQHIYGQSLVPSPVLCKTALSEISGALRPLHAEHRAQQMAEAEVQRPRMNGG